MTDAIDDEPDEIECPVCGGLGFLETEGEGTIDCEECDGNGAVAP